jgi:hypothetical protein
VKMDVKEIEEEKETQIERQTGKEMEQEIAN